VVSVVSLVSVVSPVSVLLERIFFSCREDFARHVGASGARPRAERRSALRVGCGQWPRCVLRGEFSLLSRKRSRPFVLQETAAPMGLGGSGDFTSPLHQTDLPLGGAYSPGGGGAGGGGTGGVGKAIPNRSPVGVEAIPRRSRSFFH